MEDSKALTPLSPPPRRVWIKAIADNVFAWDRTLAKGEFYEVDEDIARRLQSDGVIMVANPPTVMETAGSVAGRVFGLPKA